MYHMIIVLLFLIAYPYSIVESLHALFMQNVIFLENLVNCNVSYDCCFDDF